MGKKQNNKVVLKNRGAVRSIGLYEQKQSRPLLFGVIVFVILLPVSLVVNLPASIHEWTSGWYAMDYSLGFGSRLLIGSLFKLFFPDFLPAKTVYVFVIAVLVLILVFLLLLFSSSLFHAPKGIVQNGLSFLMILYMASPGSVAFLWSSEIFGRFDTYFVFFTVMFVLLWMKIKEYPIRCLFVFILGSLCLAIHQVYLFLYFPVIFAMLMLPIDFGEGKLQWKRLRRESRRNCLLAAAVIVLLCIQFLFYQFGSSLSIGSVSELAALLSARTDLTIMENALYLEYFAPLKEMLFTTAFNELGERIRYTVISLFLLSPIFFFYGYLWIKLIKGAVCRTEKAKYSFICFSFASYLPAFVLAKDWGRWICAFLLAALLQILLITAEKKEAVTAAFFSLNKLMHKLRFPIILYVVLIACLKKYQCILLPQAPDIFQFFYRLIRG